MIKVKEEKREMTDLNWKSKLPEPELIKCPIGTPVKNREIAIKIAVFHLKILLK